MSFSSTQLQALRAEIHGRVLVPGDDGYDTARQTWNVTTFEQQPAIVVLPLSAADVVPAVAFAREHSLSIAVQGGGHGHPLPADGALLVNFADMAAVRVTPAADQNGGTARVEAGAKWREVIGKRSIGTLLQALNPLLTGERLINGLDASQTGPHLTRAGYSPENYQRLVALKDTYDPGNLFRFNHNIAPSTT